MTSTYKEAAEQNTALETASTKFAKIEPTREIFITEPIPESTTSIVSTPISVELPALQTKCSANGTIDFGFTSEGQGRSLTDFGMLDNGYFNSIRYSLDTMKTYSSCIDANGRSTMYGVSNIDYFDLLKNKYKSLMAGVKRPEDDLSAQGFVVSLSGDIHVRTKSDPFTVLNRQDVFDLATMIYSQIDAVRQKGGRIYAGAPTRAPGNKCRNVFVYKFTPKNACIAGSNQQSSFWLSDNILEKRYVLTRILYDIYTSLMPTQRRL